MIKGCSRHVIVLKNTESDLFEEAYFIVRPKGCERKRDDLLLEANRIIRAKSGSGYEVGKRHNGRLQLIVGFVLGIIAAVPTSYLAFNVWF